MLADVITLHGGLRNDLNRYCPGAVSLLHVGPMGRSEAGSAAPGQAGLQISGARRVAQGKGEPVRMGLNQRLNPWI